jgi:hypothetical protein
VRAVLEEVYAGLDMPFDPSTAGAAEDAVPALGVDAVERALLDAYAEGATLVPGALDAATLGRARELAEDHRLT